MNEPEWTYEDDEDDDDEYYAPTFEQLWEMEHGYPFEDEDEDGHSNIAASGHGSGFPSESGAL